MAIECAQPSVTATALAAVITHDPDVVVVDIRMPPTHTDEGLRAALVIRHEHPHVGVLMLSQYIETRYTTRLLEGNSAGAGYLLKDRVADVADFVDALERVADGGTALDPDVVANSSAPNRRVDQLVALTPREHDVLALMAEGRSNSGIAARLVSRTEPSRSTSPASSTTRPRPGRRRQPPRARRAPLPRRPGHQLVGAT